MEDDRVILLNSSHDELELEAATFNTSSSKIGSPENDEQSAPDLDLPKSPGLLSEPAEPSWIVYVAAGVAAVGGFLFGYDMGIISGAKTQMQSELGLRCWHVGAVVAFLPVGAFVASLVGGKCVRRFAKISKSEENVTMSNIISASFFKGIVVDRYGRKFTIILNAFLFMVGALVLAFSSEFVLLLAGR